MIRVGSESAINPPGNEDPAYPWKLSESATILCYAEGRMNSMQGAGMMHGKTNDELFSLDLGGTTIRGHCTGAGEPVVLLHGGPGCYDYFRGSAVVEWLAPSLKVFSYDQRGCEDSPSDGPFTIAASIGDLEALRQSICTEQLTLIGHSAGALLAAHYAAARPERAKDIVLISPAGLRGGWRAAFDKTLGDRITKEQREALAIVDREILHEPDRAARGPLYQKRFNLVLPCYVDPGHRDRAPRMERYSREVNVAGFATIQASYDNPSWESRARAYPGRVLVIHGVTDPMPWSVVDGIQDIFKQAEVVPLEHCGHFPWLEEPEACRAALVAFLFAE